MLLRLLCLELTNLIVRKKVMLFNYSLNCNFYYLIHIGIEHLFKTFYNMCTSTIFELIVSIINVSFLV